MVCPVSELSEEVACGEWHARGLIRYIIVKQITNILRTLCTSLVPRPKNVFRPGNEARNEAIYVHVHTCTGVRTGSQLDVGRNEYMYIRARAPTPRFQARDIIGKMGSN